jgi:trehalose utilization protein
MSLTVTVWSEYRSHKDVGEWMSQGQKRQAKAAADVYPEGIHTVIAKFLSAAGFEVQTATLDEPSHGLTPTVLDSTDVLVWWSHYLNDEVSDKIVDRVYERVNDGMGLIVLHSARNSKIFKRLMGTSCEVGENRNDDETEILWVLDRTHPIVAGLETDSIEIPESQIMGEPFEIPEPMKVVFTSWIQGGEVFRSGCCFKRNEGRIFFFGPGHETHPVYYQPVVHEILVNSVRWAASTDENVF